MTCQASGIVGSGKARMGCPKRNLIDGAGARGSQSEYLSTRLCGLLGSLVSCRVWNGGCSCVATQAMFANWTIRTREVQGASW